MLDEEDCGEVKEGKDEEERGMSVVPAVNLVEDEHKEESDGDRVGMNFLF